MEEGKQRHIFAVEVKSDCHHHRFLESLPRTRMCICIGHLHTLHWAHKVLMENIVPLPFYDMFYPLGHTHRLDSGNVCKTIKERVLLEKVGFSQYPNKVQYLPHSHNASFCKQVAQSRHIAGLMHPQTMLYSFRKKLHKEASQKVIKKLFLRTSFF